MIVAGRLVLDDRVEPGRLTIEDGVIRAVTLDPDVDGPYVAPGYVDVHIHGWGGHDAMGDTTALDGMARVLLRHGVTSFLPTGMTAPLAVLAAFAERVRRWIPRAPVDGAEPLGFNLEGPFLAEVHKGAHEPAYLLDPADVSATMIDPLLDGLRLMTVAPERPGALALIERLHARGVRVSMGHSASTLGQAQAGYDAGGTSTTHLFNAMNGVDHRFPGLAVAALIDDRAYVELIADGEHVQRALWPIITRTKPANRLLLVSDAIPLAGTGDGRMRIGTTTLAGSVIALDSAVRNLVTSGVSLPAAVAAASRNPLEMLGIADRGRLAVGQRADLIELDDALSVRRAARAGHWLEGT